MYRLNARTHTDLVHDIVDVMYMYCQVHVYCEKSYTELVGLCRRYKSNIKLLHQVTAKAMRYFMVSYGNEDLINIHVHNVHDI